MSQVPLSILGLGGESASEQAYASDHLENRLGALGQCKARHKPPPLHTTPGSSKPLSQSLSNQGCRLPRLELVPASSQPLPSAANPAHLHVDRACHHGCWGQLKLKKREEIYAKLLIAFVCNEIIQYSSDYRI